MSEVTPIKLDLNLCELDADEALATETEDELEKNPKRKYKLVAMVVAAGVTIAAIAAFMQSPFSMRVMSPLSLNAKNDAYTLDGKGVTNDNGLSRSDDSHDAVHTDALAPAADKKNEKKDAKVISDPPLRVGEIVHFDDATFLMLYPNTISVQIDGRMKHLRVSVAIETNDNDAAQLLDHGFFLQDMLVSIARSANDDAFGDPNSSWIRGQFHRRIQGMLPNVEIHRILLTEFIVI